MFNTPIAAADEMRQLFKDGWDAVDWEGATITIAKPEVRWHGKEKKADPIPETYFVRHAIRGAGSDGAGFLENGQGASNQVYDTYGNVFVQVFAPIDAVDSYRIGELLAIAARDIHRGVETPSACWFRKARYVELDDDGKFYRWNVTAEFDFSEV